MAAVVPESMEPQKHVVMARKHLNLTALLHHAFIPDPGSLYVAWYATSLTLKQCSVTGMGREMLSRMSKGPAGDAILYG